MKYYKEMSVNDIASELDISVGTVKWHLSDIRSGLKERIDMVKNDNVSVNSYLFCRDGTLRNAGSNRRYSRYV